jgi:predicted amidohydrolase
VLVLGPPAGARTVRVFAMNPKLDLAWMESRDTYRAKMFALADRTLRGGDAPLIQDGAGDMASRLRGADDAERPVKTARDLVVWPEDIGLFAALTGQRGAPARSSGSLEGSILTLATIMGPQNAYYAPKYPDAANRPLPVRLTLLSLTDTFARVAVETFAEMAQRYRVWLEAGVNMAQEWQVVCNDRAAFNAAEPPRLPTGQLCQEENPEKVQQLGDPFEPGRDYVYEAVTGKVSNMALVFDPSGRIVARQVKTYITPVELPGVGLDLVPGDPDTLGAVRTPVGTLGFVTSKDAWMPDVIAKLDQRRVDVLVQPEFFVNDLVGAEGMWAPDTLRASGYNDVLRSPSMEVLVLPELVGNIFNFSADAQAHIAVEPRGGASSRAGRLVGQPDGPGLVDVAPWVVPDPVRAGEPFDERRKRLAEAGRALAPGSGVACPDPSKPGPCENGHVEGVLWRDIEVDRAPRYRRYSGARTATRFSAARPVAPSKRAQRNAALARFGRHLVLAYEERRGGRDQVVLVTSGNGGRTWSKPVRPTGRAAGSTDEWWPAVAIGPRRELTVAWMDRSSDRERVYFARSGDGGRTFSKAAPLDASAPAGAAQWRPALANGRDGVVHAAFVDQRERSEDDAVPQSHLLYTRIRDGSVEETRRLDTGTPAELAQKLDHSWAPRISARGNRVLVTWLDFLRYDWDVFARQSEDNGATFGDQQDVNDTNERDEALNDTPEAALGGTKPFIAWTDWRKTDATQTEPHRAYDIFVAAPGGANRQIDPYGGRQVSAFSPSICATTGDDAIVAFQDASRGQNDVQAVHLRGGTKRGAARRIDDVGDRGGNAWRPRLGCWGDDVVAVWEDERDGPPQIYAAVTKASRLR